MAVKVVMPKLGLTMTEGKIVRWLKKEGEWVEKGEPLLEILTEKIMTEVESPGQGVLRKILHMADEVVPVTETIAIIAAENDDISELIGEGPAPESPADKDTAYIDSVKQAEINNGRKASSADERLKVSPLARKIAADQGVTTEELRKIKGSGPGGRIVKNDILDYCDSRLESPVSSAKEEETQEIVPLTELRRVIASRMAESWTTTPHFYLEAEVNVEELLSLRTRINEKLSGQNIIISMNDMIVKAAAVVLSRHSYINASYTDNGIYLKKEINIGVAVGLDDGLIVPVIKNAEQKGLGQLASESRRLIEKARSGELSIEDITGGTFTVSNLGMYSVDAFTAIINPPECAILSVGAINNKVVMLNDELICQSHMRISVGFDHRVVDGLTGAKFLADLKQTLENPVLMIL